MFCDNLDEPTFKTLRDYVEIVREIAEDFDAVLVPLQRRIDEQIKAVLSEKWSDDIVHPFLWAHPWIAYRWLETTALW